MYVCVTEEGRKGESEKKHIPSYMFKEKVIEY